MSTINDGGPAYPRPIGARQGVHSDGQIGMSLRDHFAGLAMSGVLAGLSAPDRHFLASLPGGGADTIAQASYTIADAMIRERNTKPSTP